MLKYAHVGYAKAASKWLQLFLFPRHPDLYHFGRSNSDEIIDDDLRIVLWNDLLTRPSLLYDPREVAGIFHRLFDRAAESSRVACGISQEVLTLSLVGNLDISERARRLRAAMGEDTRIVIIVRNQLDWIRSMFCGLLKEGGMPLGLDEFLFYFYYQQDQSPFYTLFYDEVYELYVDLFGADNVHVIPFELIKRDARLFATEVCNAIGVATPDAVPVQSVNERPAPEALTACLNYNRKNSFHLGANYFRRPFASMVAPMFRIRFGIEPPAWIAEEKDKSVYSFINMQAMVEEAKKHGRVPPPLDTTFPDNYEDLFARAYAPHNVRLMKATRVDLNALGYPV